MLNERQIKQEILDEARIQTGSRTGRVPEVNVLSGDVVTGGQEVNV